jgi:hypothetical protein
MYFIFINYGIVFGNCFSKSGRKIIGQFFDFSQPFIAAMIHRTIGNMDFFKYEVEETALTAQRQKLEGIREKDF